MKTVHSDLAGQVSGSLTAIAPLSTGGLWFCKCACGNFATATGYVLTTKRLKSCGCGITPRPIKKLKYDLTGHTVGFVTAIRPDDTDRQKWICKCICGKETSKWTSNLITNAASSSLSCGCRKIFEKGQGGARAKFNSYRGNAKEHGRSVEFTFEEFKELVQRDCFYCGSPPTHAYYGNSVKSEAGREFSKFYCNGLDRIDSALNYTYDNIVTCCSKCNYAKRDMSQDEFLQWLAKTYLHMFGDKG